ncbi:MAG TPA: hypothetical protein VGF92_04155 [Stellaceae bacterium]|jgi:hypothetical protein
METAERPVFERAVAKRLITSGKLDQAAVDRVSRLQIGNNERLEALLIKLGLAGECDVADALAGELGIAVARLYDNDRPLGAGAEEGMRSMYEDGIAKAIAGITPVAEVLRVTREI